MRLTDKRLKLFVLLAALIAMVPQWTARAQSTTIVIGEIQTRGSAGATDEFVEFYNLSASSVDVSDYRLYYRACTSTTDSLRYTFPSGTTLQPYQHYLITGPGYDGTSSGDGTFSASIADCGGLQLRTGGGAVIDSLAYTWSGGTVPTNGFAEDTYFGFNPHNNTDGTNQDTSMERLPGTLSAVGGHKNGQDTDDNSGDFFATAASNPENMSSPLAVTLLAFGTASRAAPAWVIGLAVSAVGLLSLRLLFKRRPAHYKSSG